jgi:hypothetical protein
VIQYSRAPAIDPLALCDTGYSAFAEYDDWG